MAPAIRRWQPKRRSASTWTTLGIIALAVAVVIAAVVWNLHALDVVESCPRVVEVSGDATVSGHAPAITRVQPGEKLDAGMTGTLRLEWFDHTIVDLGGGALAVVVADQRKHLQLTRGDLGGLVVGPAGAANLVLDLPGGRLEVEGGRFTVVVEPGSAQVRVLLGRLRLIAGGSAPRELVAPVDADLPARGP